MNGKIFRHFMGLPSDSSSVKTPNWPKDACESEIETARAIQKCGIRTADSVRHIYRFFIPDIVNL